MRIVTVLTSLGMGGAEKQALAVAERMEKRGHTVAVLVLKPQVAEEWPTALHTRHLDIRKSPLSVLTGMARARQFLRDFKPDLIHSHSFHANVFARVLRVTAPGIRVVSTVHNVYEGGRVRMIAYRLTDLLAVRTVAVSQAVATRFIGLRAVGQRRCFVIRNGIDTNEFAPGAERRTRMREAEGADASFIWLVAGRLVPAKDFPNLLRAFREVRKEIPVTQLWIAGAPADAKLKRGADGISRFVSLIGAEKGCMEHVRWLGLRRDMAALYDAADGFVLASAWEGMPLVVGEAMAMEKPVVATDTGGVREFVGDAGMVVPAGDYEALARAMIATMQQDGDERAERGHRARERIQQDFGMDIVADAWEALYREVMN